MSEHVSLSTDRVRISLRGAFVVDSVGIEVRSLRGAAVPTTLDRIALVEEAIYTVWAESLTADSIEIRHADPVVTSALRRETDGRIVTGTVRFGSHVGRTRFLVLVGGRLELEMRVGVAPRKVTWNQVQAMQQEVDAAWSGLSLAALRPTYTQQAPESGSASAPAWLALLRASVAPLDEALHEIRRRPLEEITRPRQRVRAARVMRSDATARASVRRAGGVIPNVVEARPVRGTLDTASHRWIAARLRRVVARLRRLRREEAARSPTERRRALLEELAEHQRQLERHLLRAPLAEVSGGAPAVPPLALRRRPAYATAYMALRQLEGGLSRAEGEVRPVLLELAGLYEAWCALIVVRETAEVLGVPVPASPFGVHQVGVDVRLRHGQRAAVRMAARGVEVEIVRAPRFASPSALLAQRPDLVLTVRGTSTRRIVLDAKYRRDPQTARYGVAGPPAEALGALHRYRDAIRGPEDTAGWIDEAIALFPPAADLAAYETSKLWTGLAEIGVGAIPLAPGQTDWLRRWLERTLLELA